jgi:hypothetical protein
MVCDTEMQNGFRGRFLGPKLYVVEKADGKVTKHGVRGINKRRNIALITVDMFDMVLRDEWKRLQEIQDNNTAATPDDGTTTTTPMNSTQRPLIDLVGSLQRAARQRWNRDQHLPKAVNGLIREKHNRLVTEVMVKNMMSAFFVKRRLVRGGIHSLPLFT